MKLVKVVSLMLVVTVLWGASLPATAWAQPNPPGGEVPTAQPASPAEEQKVYFPLVSNNPGVTQVQGLFGYETWYLSESNGVEKMANAGADWVRKNALLWEEVEPSRGARNWSAVASLENEFKYATSKNQEIILIIRATPYWARMSAYQNQNCSPVRQDALPDFAAFLRDVVARYSVEPYKIKYYEIWNEPDVDPSVITSNEANFGCWGNVNDPYYGGRYFGEMLKTVYPQMKNANPAAQVLVGGLLMDCDPNNPPSGKNCTASKFFEGILVSGAGNSFDGVAYHAYDYYAGYGKSSNSNWNSFWNTTGPVLRAKAQFLRNVMSAYGVSGKYLVNTEVALICGTTGSEDYCQTNEFKDTKAFYVSQAYASSYLEDLRAASWYHLFGWRASQLMNTALEGEQAFNAYAFAAGRFGNATNAWEVYVGDNYVKAIDFSVGNKLVRVMWTLDGNSHTISVPTSTTAIWVWDSATGNYKSVTVTSTVNVGFAPVYLEH